MRSREIILGDSGTCQFVVVADEEGGDVINGLGDAIAVAVVEETCIDGFGRGGAAGRGDGGRLCGGVAGSRCRGQCDGVGGGGCIGRETGGGEGAGGYVRGSLRGGLGPRCSG